MFLNSVPGATVTRGFLNVIDVMEKLFSSCYFLISRISTGAELNYAHRGIMRLFDRSGSQVLMGLNSITLQRQTATFRMKEWTSSYTWLCEQWYQYSRQNCTQFLDMLTLLYQRPCCKWAVRQDHWQLQNGGGKEEADPLVVLDRMTSCS